MFVSSLLISTDPKLHELIYYKTGDTVIFLKSP